MLEETYFVNNHDETHTHMQSVKKLSTLNILALLLLIALLNAFLPAA